MDHIPRYIRTLSLEVAKRELADIGFIGWLSREQDNVDETGMREGVLQHEVVVLIATKGIFHRDRHWVTHVELKTAIDASTLRSTTTRVSFRYAAANGHRFNLMTKPSSQLSVARMSSSSEEDALALLATMDPPEHRGATRSAEAAASSVMRRPSIIMFMSRSAERP